MKRLLLIGGTDSSGGAGLTRDVRVAQDYGCHAKPIVTCVTAQTNAAVQCIHKVPSSVIAAQIEAAVSEDPPDAIKIGMVGSAIAAKAIANALAGSSVPIVLDPVLKSSSSGQLTGKDVLTPLIKISSVLTPNLEEAAILCDQPFANLDAQILDQARMLRDQGAAAVLIKGGHGKGDCSCDYLLDEEGGQRFCLPRLTKSKRGTGCSLGTALGCELAFGHNLQEACDRAKKYVQCWIDS